MAIIAVAISGFSIWQSFDAFKKADMALALQSADLDENRLARIEGIFLDCYAGKYESGNDWTGDSSHQIAANQISLCLNKINAAHPQFYDLYLANYHRHLKEYNADEVVAFLGDSPTREEYEQKGHKAESVLQAHVNSFDEIFFAGVRQERIAISRSVANAP